MNPEQAVAEGRVEAEALMTDTLLVTRRSGNPVTGPDGKVTIPTETVHDGIGRIQGRSSEGLDKTVAGAAVLIVTFQAQVPVSVPLKDGDEIRVTASEMDSMMVGRKFRVESVVRKTHATKTTANVEEAP
ncbi:DUF6093 family protein [Nesterenkonia aurantiaca]|uniref:DUF6093 family protein n=1 Tax=Nesterenkonia aurantiaca TaxID=1436010 RepID=UPI003EE5E8D0